MSGMRARPRILVVAPFTHQNGHFVVFPRDLSCALQAAGCEVTLLHARPFRTELDWRGSDVRRICLRDRLEGAPWWWKEIWARLAGLPSAQCLAWIIWQVRPRHYDLVLWTDFQAQRNLWPLTVARALRLYRWKTAFFEHHPPDERGGCIARLPLDPDRIRLAGLTMFVFSKQLREQWAGRLGRRAALGYVPWGVWPEVLSDVNRRQARRRLDIDQEARVLLVFGVQAVRRKHIDTLHQAAASLAPSKPLLLLFVGAAVGHEPHPFSGWRHDGLDVRIDNGFIPEEQVRDYFACADAVWANYRDFPGASGALLQAMGFGRIAIASGDGEIGALCRENDLGLTVASAGSESLGHALEQFAAMPAERQLAWERDVAAKAARYAWPRVALQLMAQLGFNEPETVSAQAHDTPA